MIERLFLHTPTDERLENSVLFKMFYNKDLRGDTVTRENALLYDTVYSCINVLSDDIAKLPLKTYHRTEEGSIYQVKDNDVHYVLRIRPNRYMSPFTFLKLAITDLMIHGNFYAYIRCDKKTGTKIEELIPLTPNVTHPLLDKKGNLFYQTTFNGKDITLFADEVIHLKGMSKDGITGMSPIEAVREHIESNQTATRYNNKMLSEGALPQGVLTAQGQLNKDAKDAVRSSWQETNRGQNIAIIDSGLDYKQIGISQKDIQWLDGQRYNTQRIASIFKVPLHKINDLENATYSNIEQQSLDYVKNTLQPLVTQIESEFSFKLYSEELQRNDYYVKFNMDSELRGDSLTRAKVNQIDIQNGFKTLNEIRSQNEDSPYLEDYANEPFITLNIAPAKNIQAFNDNRFGEKLNGMIPDEGGDES